MLLFIFTLLVVIIFVVLPAPLKGGFFVFDIGITKCYNIIIKQQKKGYIWLN